MTDVASLEDRPLAWRVTGGGQPTPAQLAAIAIALTPVAAPPAGDDSPDEDDGGRRVSNWVRAAMVEGVGGRPPTSAQDLVQGRFGLGFVGDPLSNG